MSSNEKAEAILIVLKRIGKAILKWAGIVIAAIIAISLVIWAYSSINEWYSVDRHKDKIIVVASFDGKVCPDKKFPLMLAVGNESSKTIKNIYISLTVTKKGFSSKLNNWRGFEYDKIIEPGGTWTMCWAVNSTDYDKPNLDGVEMDVVVDSFNPTFKE